MSMASSIAAPVIAGLAVGIAFIILFGAFGNGIVAISSNNGVVQMLSDGDDQVIVPDNFKITYSYGIGLDRTLTVDYTAIGSFTVKNCYSITPPQHATLALSQQELKFIWKAVQENDFFSLSDLTEKCSPLAISCREIAPEDKAELQITSTNGETNKVEFRQNYALNHNNAAELKRFKAIVSAIDEVLSHYGNLPRPDCVYA
jgi:hypothetical protein